MLVLILASVDACQRGYNWECTDEQMNLACEVRDEGQGQKQEWWGKGLKPWAFLASRCCPGVLADDVADGRAVGPQHAHALAPGGEGQGVE